MRLMVHGGGLRQAVSALRIGVEVISVGLEKHFREHKYLVVILSLLVFSLYLHSVFLYISEAYEHGAKFVRFRCFPLLSYTQNEHIKYFHIGDPLDLVSLVFSTFTLGCSVFVKGEEAMSLNRAIGFTPLVLTIVEFFVKLLNIIVPTRYYTSCTTHGIMRAHVRYYLGGIRLFCEACESSEDIELGFAPIHNQASSANVSPSITRFRDPSDEHGAEGEGHPETLSATCVHDPIHTKQYTDPIVEEFSNIGAGGAGHPETLSATCVHDPIHTEQYTDPIVEEFSNIVTDIVMENQMSFFIETLLIDIAVHERMSH